MIAFDIEADAGDFKLAAAARLAGHVVALFGPSGAGKTTLLNVIAGLHPARRGSIEVAGTTLYDSVRGIDLPTRARRVGYVFQDARLFPHLTVLQNLTYGRRFALAPPLLAPAVALLDLAPLLRRRPRDLSGGEKQRVAIGRALLTAPRLLLLDEPLAALDSARKAEILPYLERLRDEVRLPILYISHAIDEAARLADDLAILRDGRVLAAGPIGEVLAQSEVAPLTGGFEIGLPLQAGVAAHLPAEGLTRLASAAGELYLPGLVAAPGDRVQLRVRPRDVTLALTRPQDVSALNVLAGVVSGLRPVDQASVEVALDCQGVALAARITRRSVKALQLAPGRPVYAMIKTLAFDRRHLGS